LSFVNQSHSTLFDPFCAKPEKTARLIPLTK